MLKVRILNLLKDLDFNMKNTKLFLVVVKMF